MGLIDRFREAEKEGRQAAHRVFDKVVQSREEMERRIRQKMRIYPKCQSAAPSEVSQAMPTGNSDELEFETQRKKMEADEGRPIVSVHGKDVVVPDDEEKAA